MNLLIIFITAMTLYGTVVVCHYSFFKNRPNKIHILPSQLRHTWVWGCVNLYVLSTFTLYAIPVSLKLATFTFALGLILFHTFAITDLENHKRTWRGPVQHSPNCYMDKGNEDTWATHFRKKTGAKQ